MRMWECGVVIPRETSEEKNRSYNGDENDNVIRRRPGVKETSQDDDEFEKAKSFRNSYLVS
jgi:hypothetical protein